MKDMKVWLMTAYSCAVLLTTPACADDADVLQSRLHQVNSFCASFIQQVTGSEGLAIQEGTGTLLVKRPNFFNWHMISPDKSLLISDGKTLLFYTPFVEQATANWLKNAIGNTPVMLITHNSTDDWHQYKVKRQGDNFSLVSKSDNDNIRKMTIKVTENGTIERFSLVEKDGQCSAYQLQNQKNVQVENAKFYFTFPEGVTLDDQRQWGINKLFIVFMKRFFDLKVAPQYYMNKNYHMIFYGNISHAHDI